MSSTEVPPDEGNSENLQKSSKESVKKEGSVTGSVGEPTEPLEEGTTEAVEDTSGEPAEQGSKEDIKKAEIFGGEVKEDSAPASKVPSLKSIKSYESPKTSKGSIKSPRGSQGSRVPSSTRASVGSKGSIKSHVSSTVSYGSGGPCKIFDKEELGSRDSLGSHATAKEIALGIIESLLPQGSDATILSTEHSAGTVSQISELKEETPTPSMITPDNVYLKKHLGAPLTLALAEIVMKQPTDPIHYLGHWLFKWRWNQEHKQQKEDQVLALYMERKRIQEEIEEQERIRAEREAILEAERIAREDARAIVEYAVERAFHTMDAREIVEEIFNRTFPPIHEEEEAIDAEEARDEFDVAPVKTED